MSARIRLPSKQEYSCPPQDIPAKLSSFHCVHMSSRTVVLTLTDQNTCLEFAFVSPCFLKVDFPALPPENAHLAIT